MVPVSLVKDESRVSRVAQSGVGGGVYQYRPDLVMLRDLYPYLWCNVSDVECNGNAHVAPNMNLARFVSACMETRQAWFEDSPSIVPRVDPAAVQYVAVMPSPSSPCVCLCLPSPSSV